MSLSRRYNCFQPRSGIASVPPGMPRLTDWGILIGDLGERIKLMPVRSRTDGSHLISGRGEAEPGEARSKK